MKFDVQSNTRGIKNQLSNQENQLSNQELVQNGTFFNTSIAPRFGYDPNARIMNPNTRKKYKLEPVDSVPTLSRDCGVACLSHYVGQDADWV